MARSKKNRVLATFKHPVTVRVLTPEFELLDAIRHLDVKALANAAKAEIGLGYVGCCCGCRHQLLRAVIRKGMVTGLRVDEPPKKDRTLVSPEFAKIFTKAHSDALKQLGRLPKFPMRVGEFFNRGVAYDLIGARVHTHMHLGCLRHLLHENRRAGSRADMRPRHN